VTISHLPSHLLTSMHLKHLAFLLYLCSSGGANPIGFALDDQIPLRQAETTYPGFDLDLNSRRLVQLEGQDPVWMTELEKVVLLVSLYASDLPY